MEFWQVLPVAVSLVFILEGVLPFLSPNRWRQMMTLVVQMDDGIIRNFGLGSMIFGLFLLYIVN